MSEYKIPFNKPSLVGNEIEYIIQAVRGGHASGDGPFTKKCHRLLEEALGVPKVLLTTSCTHALEMAALLLDIQPGDEVIEDHDAASAKGQEALANILEAHKDQICGPAIVHDDHG